MPISGTYTSGDAVSFGDCDVDIDLSDTGTWAAVESWSTEIVTSGGEIPTTQVYPFAGSAIVFTGVKGPITINCTIVYTEGSTSPYWNIRTRYESGDNLPMEIRWSPKGSASGNLRFTSNGGKLTACPLPNGAGDAASANVATVTITADSVTMSRL